MQRTWRHLSGFIAPLMHRRRDPYLRSSHSNDKKNLYESVNVIRRCLPSRRNRFCKIRKCLWLYRIMSKRYLRFVESLGIPWRMEHRMGAGSKFKGWPFGHHKEPKEINKKIIGTGHRLRRCIAAIFYAIDLENYLLPSFYRMSFLLCYTVTTDTCEYSHEREKLYWLATFLEIRAWLPILK